MACSPLINAVRPQQRPLLAGHSTGGGEVVRYIARHGEDKVSKAVLISAVPPLMVKTDSNPQGTPKSVFDDMQAQLAANRAQFYYDVPAGPFYHGFAACLRYRQRLFHNDDNRGNAVLCGAVFMANPAPLTDPSLTQLT